MTEPTPILPYGYGRTVPFPITEENRMSTYRIVRHYQQDHESEVIVRGLTLEQAQAHCNDPETSSRTATEPAGLERTERMGQWFDGYTEER